MNADSLVNFILEQTAKKEWTPETVLRVGVDVAAKVNQIKELKGQEKKQLVLDVIQKAMVKCEAAEKDGKTDTAEITERWSALRKVASDVLPVSLDLVVSAARGGFDFKKISAKSWLEYFCCSFRAVVGVLAAEHVISGKVADVAGEVAKKAEEKMVVLVDLSGAEQLKQVCVENLPAVLPSNEIKNWSDVAVVTVPSVVSSVVATAVATVEATVETTVVSAIPESVESVDVVVEETPQSENSS